MGMILSSYKDYNRVLAKQPRKSLGLSKLEPSKSLQQHPLTESLSIPVPVRISQFDNKTPILLNQSSIINQSSESNHTSIQSIQSENSFPIFNNQIQQEQQTQKESIIQNSSNSQSSNFPMYNQTMNGYPVVISRSVTNLNNHQRLNNNHLSLLQPNRTIIERNGKQFLSEFKERIERRYVQVFDETIGEMRLFEVTDYIPSRIIRSIKHNSQFQQQNGTSRNTLSSSFRSNQRSGLPSTSNSRIEPAKPSNLVDFKGLNDRDTLAREFNLYHSGADLPFNNTDKNNTSSTAPYQPQPQPQPQPQSQTPTNPQPTIQNPTNTASTRSQHSEPKTYNPSSITSQDARNQYSSGSYHSQAPSLHPHSPTGSDYSVTASDANSENSNDESDTEDDEGIDRTKNKNNRSDQGKRNKISVSYGTSGGYNSPPQIDPFARSVNATDHHYAKRPGINNYSEPVRNNRGFHSSAASDYAPIPNAIKSPNQDQYSYREDSNTSAYNG